MIINLPDRNRSHSSHNSHHSSPGSSQSGACAPTIMMMMTILVISYDDDYFALTIPSTSSPSDFSCSTAFSTLVAWQSTPISWHWSPQPKYPKNHHIIKKKIIKISTFLLLSITLAPCLPRFCAIASLHGVVSVLPFVKFHIKCLFFWLSPLTRFLQWRQSQQQPLQWFSQNSDF